jgi:hypothetical protein
VNIWHECVCQRSKDIASAGRYIRDICGGIDYTGRGLINYGLICYDRLRRIVSAIVSGRVINTWINTRLILAKLLELFVSAITIESRKANFHLLIIDLMLCQLCLVIGKETTLVARLFVVNLQYVCRKPLGSRRFIVTE